MADKPLTQEQQQALQALGAGAAFNIVVPAATILPFQNYLSDKSKTNIKQQEALRMFPQADPRMFDNSLGGALKNVSLNPLKKITIPLDQSIASSRIFNTDVHKTSPLDLSNLYKGQEFYPTFLNVKPSAPSPELGSYAQTVANKTIFPEGDIQAITVTPAPNPSRFAQDYAEILADKLGKTINEREQYVNKAFEIGKFDDSETLNKLNKKVDVLSNKVPGTAGYVWGNINKPQYTYAEGNWGLGQKEAGANPAIYLSRINADPSKEADYLFTSNILTRGSGVANVDPRAKFTQYPDSGPGTGPSWGVSPRNKDISFRKDLIGARGELTTGDLQALLAERNLPFAYQSYKKTPEGDSIPTQDSGDVLRKNLQKLADAEGISTAQAIERFARVVPNIGEPTTPPTPAVTGTKSAFSAIGPTVNPSGKFAAKTDLRQIGILPPADKASYSPFTVDEFDTLFNYVYPRYSASDLKPVDLHKRIIETNASRGAQEAVNEFIKNTNNSAYDLIIDRDMLRPQAANKLLNRTVDTLIEQAEPVKGLGLGGLAAGGIATAMDPQVIDALSQGNYIKAGSTAALNTTIGSLTGGLTAKGLQALQAAGYARPAAVVGEALPVAGGVIAGLGAIETGKALNRAYKARTGKDWVTRNQISSSYPTYTGPTPEIKPRMGVAILGGKPVSVPYGSVAGTKTVGRPWWDTLGSKVEAFANLLNSGSIIGR